MIGRNMKTKQIMRRKKEKLSRQEGSFPLSTFFFVKGEEIQFFILPEKIKRLQLAAYYTPPKQVYCALWSENLSFRAGNDIASAFHKILTVLSEENDITELIIWSDSCVPQNRKFSHFKLSSTFSHKDDPQVKSVTMKYSLPGHSCVQEVDSFHSNIEKAMNKTDFYSPIELIRILKQVNPRHAYRVIQMRPDDFKDF
ncbi:hypothetical protein AVEN_35570-1 [Araneus ventricosus]|uniref:Uncharacterized protein n=1 Tax=Araneus ventricosus TaxID=182803 RepID=A0A4Y2CM43_ARAVE|nr:hypothetical protein AVEN_35570-1 [Araneus ventricosus]